MVGAAAAGLGGQQGGELTGGGEAGQVAGGVGVAQGVAVLVQFGLGEDSGEFDFAGAGAAVVGQGRPGRSLLPR